MDHLQEKIVRTEEAVKDVKRRVEALERKDESLIKLATVVEMQVEVNKKQNEQMEQFGITLGKINVNLDGLNSGLKAVEQRVEKIEKVQDDKKIDLGQLAKDIIFKVVPAVLVAYVLIKLGLQ